MRERRYISETKLKVLRKKASFLFWDPDAKTGKEYCERVKFREEGRDFFYGFKGNRTSCNRSSIYAKIYIIVLLD